MLSKQELELLLSNRPDFRQLPGEALNKLLGNSSIKTTPGGIFMDSEQQRCGSLEILLEGMKRIYKVDESGKVFNLFTLSAYQICPLNVLCILTNEPFPALTQTLSPLRSISIPAADLLLVCSDFPVALQMMLRSVHTDVSSLIMLLSEIVFRGVRDRLMDLLRNKAMEGVIMGSHQNLADELGTSREVVSKLLKQMEREGMLTMSRMRIQLLSDETARLIQ